MIPPVALQSSSISRKIQFGKFLAAVVLVLSPAAAFAQHGSHGGGGHVSAPHVNAPPPPPRASAPRPAPRTAVAPPRSQTGVVIHPAPRILVPPTAATGSVPPLTNSTTNQDSTHRNNAIGFPPSTVFPRSSRSFTPRTGVTLNGDGHSLWVTRTTQPGPGGLGANRVIHGGPRRFWPFPTRTFPVYYPIFYPIGLFGGYPSFGFGACDPFWGWSFGCGGFAFGNYYNDGYWPMLSYEGPAEPSYIPVPSDGNTTGEQEIGRASCRERV